MSLRLLIAIFGDVLAWTIPDADVARIRDAAPDVTVVHARTDAELIREIPGAHIAFSYRIGPDVFPLARRLRWIHTPAAGVGSLLTPALRQSDVVLTNSRGVHAAPIAEHVLAVTIALSRRVHTAVRRQVQHVWAQNELTDPSPYLVRGRTMGIVGLGAIGAEVARLAAAIGMRVIAVRRRPQLSTPAIVEQVWGADRLDDLLAQAHVVVLAAPLTAATEALIGRDRLARMRRDAVLVNIGRGKLIDEPALVAALRDGTIAGAALDVVEHEPLAPDSPLWELPNVLITPHTSGLRADYWPIVTDLFLENLGRFRRGERLENVVDKDQGH